MKKSGAIPKKQSNDLGAITVGYVMIPVNVDRDGYIQTCYRTNRICVLVEGGLFKTDVYITNEAIQNISFPEKAGEKGTQVVIASGTFRNQPIIIGTVQGNDETPNWIEESVRFRKSFGSTMMLFSMNPKNKKLDINITDTLEPTELSIIVGGNEEHKINLQSSGSVNVTASKKIKVTGYDTIEADIIIPQDEVKDPGKDERKVTLNRDKFEVIRRVQDKQAQFVIDDQKIAMNFNNEKESILINENNIVLSYSEAQEQIQLAQNLIKLLTGAKVEINGAAEPLTLANTLIQLLNNVQTQVTTLKQAWTSALAGAGSMDGGRLGFTAGQTTVSTISPLNFDAIKSKVIFSD
jgi:hypothetical protein